MNLTARGAAHNVADAAGSTHIANLTEHPLVLRPRSWRPMEKVLSLFVSLYLSLILSLSLSLSLPLALSGARRDKVPSGNTCVLDSSRSHPAEHPLMLRPRSWRPMEKVLSPHTSFFKGVGVAVPSELVYIFPAVCD